MNAKNVEAEAMDFAEKAKTVVEENAARMSRGMEDYATFAKDTAREFAKSAGVANKAAEKIGTEAVATAAQSVKDGVALFREAADVKNVADLVDLQTNYLAKACSDAIARTSAATDVVRGAMENAVGVTAERAAAFAGLARAQ